MTDEDLNQAADRQRERQRAAQRADDQREALWRDAETAAETRSVELDGIAVRIAAAAAALPVQLERRQVGVLRRTKDFPPAFYSANAPGQRQHGKLRELKFDQNGIEQIIFWQNDSRGRSATPLEELIARSRRPGVVPREAETDFEGRQEKLAAEIRQALESFMGAYDIRL